MRCLISTVMLRFADFEHITVCVLGMGAHHLNETFACTTPGQGKLTVGMSKPSHGCRTNEERCRTRAA